jgi:hypothetical protein
MYQPVHPPKCKPGKEVCRILWAWFLNEKHVLNFLVQRGKQLTQYLNKNQINEIISLTKNTSLN